MIAGFGKEIITIGSAPGCDVVLTGQGVAPQHAQVRRVGAGQLVFVDLGAGPSTAGGAPLPPRGEAPFDFRNVFTVGSASVPLAHDAFALMLMSVGQASREPGKLVFGRDPAQANVVIAHPNVSGRHATASMNPLSIVDHRSTSKTWLGQTELPPETPHPLQTSALLALGPIPVSAHLLNRLLTAAAAMDTRASEARQNRRKSHQTVIGQIVTGSSSASDTRTIGRTPDNDIQISHAQVSSRHALLHRSGDQLFIEDCGSANGTYVRGERIPPGQRVAIAPGEKVFVGPMPLLLQSEEQQVAVVVEDSESWSGRPLYEIEAWDLVLEVDDRDNPGARKVLLDHVSFKALPGDFIALMGPSGAGKTTLLLTLNGYLPPSAGQVRINGEDLYSIYDALRGSIGYVPQDDIVHPELTVWEAVRYSARFRLPPDYSEEEIDRLVATTLQQLGLEAVKHLQIGKPERKILSGGQRKRVNIAMELVTDPVIMFLDEPTSGLAADDTTALVTLLADLARDTGKTIITTIHQPAKDEFEKFNLALIMGTGGVPIFYGPTAPDAYRFFGSWKEQLGQVNDVDNPRDMFDMLKQREEPTLQALRRRDPNASRAAARASAAQAWHDEFFKQQHPTFQKMYSGDRAVGAGTARHGVPTGRPPTKGQFGLLFSRYFKVKMRDVSGTAIMFAQAPIIGVLLAIVFGFQKEAIPYWCLGALQELSKSFGAVGGKEGASTADVIAQMSPTPDHAGAISFLVVAAVWFGTSNAAREIVSERAIYLRERMVNLGLFNYVVSKFCLLSIFTFIQCLVLLAIVFFSLGFHGGINAFMITLGTLVVTALNSIAVGLLLSTLVTSSEAAMALTPIALLPQVVLSGLMVPMTTNDLLRWPMYIMPARWGFQGVVAQERLAVANDPAWIIDLGRSDTALDKFVVDGKFKCAEAQIASTEFNGAWGFAEWRDAWLPPAVLAGMMAVTALSILILLKRRDRV